MQNQYEKPFVSLWIIRVQNFYSKIFHSKIIASVMLIYVPIMVSGLILQSRLDYFIFTRGIIISLAWTAISPFLIQDSLSLINNFLNNQKHIFRNGKEWKKLYDKEIKQYQSLRYLYFGFPFAIIVTAIILFTIFNTAPLLIQLWAAVSYFVMMFIGSTGFYAIYRIILIVFNVCAADINFNPYHPDKFGGFSSFGNFSVKGAIYFSSGAMVFPLVFEVLDSISFFTDLFEIVVYFIVGFYILIMITSFILPMIRIKNFVDVRKEKIILESRSEFDKMIDDFRHEKEINIKQGIDIYMYYKFKYVQLFELKNYPYDFRVLAEFALSFFIPLCVALIEIFL